MFSLCFHHVSIIVFKEMQKKQKLFGVSCWSININDVFPLPYWLNISPQKKTLNFRAKVMQIPKAIMPPRAKVQGIPKARPKPRQPPLPPTQDAIPGPGMMQQAPGMVQQPGMFQQPGSSYTLPTAPVPQHMQTGYVLPTAPVPNALQMVAGIPAIPASSTDVQADAGATPADDGLGPVPCSANNFVGVPRQKRMPRSPMFSAPYTVMPYTDPADADATPFVADATPADTYEPTQTLDDEPSAQPTETLVEPPQASPCSLCPPCTTEESDGDGDGWRLIASNAGGDLLALDYDGELIFMEAE